MSKLSALVLIVVLAASSIMMIEYASAQTIPKPAVPEFSLTLTAYPYDVPPNSETDPYTGQKTLTQTGYHVENKSIEMRIKNQPFTVYKDANGKYITLQYEVRCKGHSQDNWSGNESNRFVYASSCMMIHHGEGIEAVDSLADPNAPYTIVPYPLDKNQQSQIWFRNFPDSGQVDFQVRALIGYDITLHEASATSLGKTYQYIFTGEASDWSTTQTLAIPGDSVSVSPTPSVPEFPVLAILALFVVVPLVTIMLLRKKRN